MPKKKKKNYKLGPALNAYLDAEEEAGNEMSTDKAVAAMKKLGHKMTKKRLYTANHDRNKKAELANGKADKKRQKQSDRRKKHHGVTADGVRQTRKFADRIGGTEALREHLEILEVAQG